MFCVTSACSLPLRSSATSAGGRRWAPPRRPRTAAVAARRACGSPDPTRSTAGSRASRPRGSSSTRPAGRESRGCPTRSRSPAPVSTTTRWLASSSARARASSCASASIARPPRARPARLDLEDEPALDAAAERREEVPRAHLPAVLLRQRIVRARFVRLVLDRVTIAVLPGSEQPPAHVALRDLHLGIAAHALDLVALAQGEDDELAVERRGRLRACRQASRRASSCAD